MTTPASRNAEAFLQRVFLGLDDAEASDDSNAEADTNIELRGVDARRQRQLERFESSDNESW